MSLKEAKYQVFKDNYVLPGIEGYTTKQKYPLPLLYSKEIENRDTRDIMNSVICVIVCII